MSNTKNTDANIETTPEPRIEAQVANLDEAPPLATPITDEPPKMADLRGIRYIGKADRKTITVGDLVSLGIENPKGDLVWSSENSNFVLADEVNAATRDWLAKQPDFVAE